MLTTPPRLALALVAQLALASLGSGCTAEPFATLRFATVTDDAPAYGEAPFPADAYLDERGYVRPFANVDDMAPLGAEIVTAHVETLDGFGLRPTVDVFFDGPLAATSIPATSSAVDAALYVMDVDAASPTRGQVVPMDWRLDPVRSRVAGSPRLGVVLREANRYAVVVTRKLTDERGTPLRRPTAFQALLDVSLAEVPRTWRSTVEALAEVFVRAPADDVLLVTAFTTQHATRDLVNARTRALEAPAPTLAFPDADIVFKGRDALDVVLGVAERDEQNRERWGWSNPTGMAHEHVGVLGTGVMTAPRFLTPDDKSAMPGADSFVLAEDGRPRIIEEAAPFGVTFVLPSTPPPASGWPIAIFGHGLGASRHQILAMAEPLTAAGYAVAAIDMNGHGARFNPQDEKNNTAMLMASFSGDPELKDGFGDITGMGTTFALIHGFENLSAIRDSVRQSVLDLGALARLLKDPALDLSALATSQVPNPHLDGARLAYLGESFGGVIGSVLSAVEPEIDLYVLDVPGGGILDLAMLGSPIMRPMIELWLGSAYGLDEHLDRFHPFVALAQACLDGGDPMSFAPHVLANRFTVGGEELSPRHVVVLEVMGDEVLPNRATHALARAFGLELLTPSLIEVPGLSNIHERASGNVLGQTAALVQWSPATHGDNWTSERGHHKFQPFSEADDEEFVALEESFEIVNPMRETLALVLGVLDTHAAGQPPTVKSVRAPVADYDADGVLDDDEVAAGRDPYFPGR